MTYELKSVFPNSAFYIYLVYLFIIWLYGGITMPNDERILETMPTGTLGLVATDSCIGLAQKVDAY